LAAGWISIPVVLEAWWMIISAKNLKWIFQKKWESLYHLNARTDGYNQKIAQEFRAAGSLRLMEA
jgi:hypothetical protein